MTRKAFIVGRPVAHSRSPLIHGYWLNHYGIDGSYERIDVEPDHFADFLRQFQELGFVGGNVTVPHKEAAFLSVDRRSQAADRIGAVNTLVAKSGGAIEGHNTDAFGFIAHLDHALGTNWVESISKKALVIGAGGAARAVVVGLLDAGITQVVIANRTRERAEAICMLDASRVTTIAWNEIPEAMETSGLLVNTTSLGMSGQDRLEVDLTSLPRNAIVSDIVYAPLETELLAQARQLGLRVVDGLGMLLHQAVPGFEHWFGVKPEITEELRELIITDLGRTGQTA